MFGSRSRPRQNPTLRFHRAVMIFAQEDILNQQLDINVQTCLMCFFKGRFEQLFSKI